jgi:subtilisin family serine protease
MEGRTGNSILGKAVLFVFLLILITAIGGMLPTIAGKKLRFERLQKKRSLVSKRLKKSIKLRFASGEFDPLMESGPDRLAERSATKTFAQGETGYYLVQFDGPIRVKQKKKLRKLGAQVFDYLPDFAFIVKMNDKTRAAVESMQQVRWVGIYQPAYRIEPALAETMMARATYLPEEFIVTIFPGEDLGSIAQQIEQLGGEVLEVSEYNARAKLKIRLGLDALETLSNTSGVKWIEEAPVWQLHNDVAAGIMDVIDVWNRGVNPLHGAGQTVAVADTGLDQGSEVPANLHDDFEDCAGGSRVSTIIDRALDGAKNDVNSGHGTHVAGSVLGNGDVSDGIPGCDYDNSYAGIAPEATLVFQALEDNATGALSGIPSDLNDLFNEAYGVGARIHTNSWGSSQAGAYTSFSEDVDQFVWNNRDFLVLFSAGNDGVDADGNGVIDPISMGSPATAKNCITVGASENNIDPINSDHVSDEATGMAAFSSRGPCLDGRIKPDIVAPGTNIISTKSSLATDLWTTGGLGGGLENSYIFSGGTSMSTPLTAGAAALVREFYTDVEGVTPSAALIKATLLNGAADISPGQYGTGSTREIPAPPRPNNVEGWGRVDLETSIFPAVPKTLRYADITTSLNTGESRIYDFTVGSGAVPLKATLVWSDYPGSTVAGGGLVNDLDLILIDTGSSRVYPNNANQRGQTEVIAYDDGGYESSWRFNGSNTGFAVRFTPASYPAVLEGVRFSMITSATAQFRCNVWDDNGSGGLPGTLLFSRNMTNISFPLGGFIDVEVTGVTITEGSFYVELRYISTNDNNPYLLTDYTGPDNRSYVFDGTSWSLLPYGAILNGDWAIQAVVVGEDRSTLSDRVNNVVGIDIPNPTIGSYSIRVEGYNVPQGPQPYALVVTGGTLSALTEVTPPVAPSNLSASSSSLTEVSLSWTDNSANEDGFKIERKIGAAGSYSPLATVGPNVTNYNDNDSGSGLTEATTYYYRMTAYNAQGDSMYSSEVNATTLPAAPSSLSATAASSIRIDLSWTDNSNGETGYKIERKIGATGTYSQVGTVGANVISYSNTGLAASTTYNYRVMAYNVTGDSAQSNEANATTPATPKLASGGGGGGGCFITTAAFGSPFDRLADLIREHESAKAQQISFGLALLATLCFVTFRRKSKR